MDVVLQQDDNLQGGMTYTFSFALQNWFHTPNEGVLLADIQNNAPTFLSSPFVKWSSATNVLNVTFNYTGDGSDVVGDVGNEIIQSFVTGSNDNFNFEQATQGTAGVTGLSVITTALPQAAGAVSESVGKTAGSITGGLTQGVTSGIAQNLGMSGWVVIVLVILGVLAYFSASTGIRVRD